MSTSFPEPKGEPVPSAPMAAPSNGKPPETVEEARARLLADKAKRDDSEVQAAKRRELEALELEARFCKELGPLGLEFDLLRTRVGTIVVKRPEEVLFKKIRDSFEGSKLPSQESLAEFVLPCVQFPERATFLAWVGKFPGIYVSCGTLLAALCNAEELEIRGK